MLLASDRRSLDVARSVVSQPLGFGSSVAAGFEEFRATQSSDSVGYLTDAAARQSLQALVEATGDDQYTNRGLGDASELDRLRKYGPQIAILRQQGVEIPSAEEVEEQARTRVALLRAQAQRAGGVGAFVGAAGAALRDPINAMTLPFGASAGSTVLRAALAEAGVAMASETAIQAIAAGDEERAALDIQPTLGSAVGAVATAGVGAAGLTGLLRGVGKAFDKAVADGRVKPNYEQQVARDAVEEGVAQAEGAPVKGARGLDAHAQATVEAVRAVDEGRLAEPEAVYSGRFRETLDAASEVEGRAVETADLVAEAESALRKVTRAQGARNVLLEARGHFRDLGRTAEVKVTGDAVTLRVGTVGDFYRELTLPKKASRQEARRALDGFADELGLDRPTPSRLERTAAELEPRIAEADKAQTRSRQASRLKQRVVDGVLLDRSPTGVVRPFKTRKAAQEFGQRTLKDGFEVVRKGRGFGLVEAEAPLARGARETVAEVAPESALTRQDVVDSDASNLTDRSGRVDRIEADSKEPTDFAADDSVPEVVTENLDQMVQLEGMPEPRRVGDIMREIEEDVEAARFVKNCMLG